MFFNILTRFNPESIPAWEGPIQGIRSKKQYYASVKWMKNNSTDFGCGARLQSCDSFLANQNSRICLQLMARIERPYRQQTSRRHPLQIIHARRWRSWCLPTKDGNLRQRGFIQDTLA